MTLYFKKIPSSHFFKHFVLSRASHNTTSPNIGGRMHGLSPPQMFTLNLVVRTFLQFQAFITVNH